MGLWVPKNWNNFALSWHPNTYRSLALGSQFSKWDTNPRRTFCRVCPCGIWSSICGIWSSLCGIWSSLCGIWSSICGIWSSICGIWSSICGIWSSICGIWSEFVYVVYVCPFGRYMFVHVVYGPCGIWSLMQIGHQPKKNFLPSLSMWYMVQRLAGRGAMLVRSVLRSACCSTGPLGLSHGSVSLPTPLYSTTSHTDAWGGNEITVMKILK